MRKNILSIICVLFVGVFVFGCGKTNTEDNNKISVVTTLFATYDFAKEVGGDKVDVSMLIPPGVDSHTYEPNPRDITKLRQAKIFIYCGGESDAWLEKILATVDNDKLIKIKLMDVIKPVEENLKEGMTKSHEDHNKDKEEVEYDEHVWTSPVNGMKIVAKIAEVLKKVDGEHKSFYETNANFYIKKLKTLDQELRTIVANSKRKTIIFGDRFPLRYFVDEYKLDYYAAFPGCAQNTEANAATIAFLLRKIKEENIPVVFHIELSNKKIAKILSEETGAKMLEFNTCHNVTKAQMESGVTYESLMKANAKALKEALN